MIFAVSIIATFISFIIAYNIAEYMDHRDYARDYAEVNDPTLMDEIFGGR